MERLSASGYGKVGKFGTHVPTQRLTTSQFASRSVSILRRGAREDAFDPVKSPCELKQRDTGHMLYFKLFSLNAVNMIFMRSEISFITSSHFCNKHFFLNETIHGCKAKWISHLACLILDRYLNLMRQFNVIFRSLYKKDLLSYCAAM